MRTRIGWLAAVALALWPATARPQGFTNYNYEVPPSSTVFPGPIGHYRMEEGGFFMGLDGLYWSFSNPLRGQTVAVRGFRDMDGSITGTVGNFVGSGDEALNTRQVKGPYTFTPGFHLILGWRFESGTVLMANWIHFQQIRYSAHATLIPKGARFGQQLEDTFLFSDVFNFPADYAGEDQNVNGGAAGATFGIWNAASLMEISFLQRYDQFDLAVRLPMWATEMYRNYALVGPRLAWIWERFRWRTADFPVTGDPAAPDDIAIYSNVVSNRLYGVHIGGGNEWFMGDTPLGGFSVSLEGETGLFIDFVKERAKYELADRTTAATRARNVFSLVPLASAKINLWWYPLEAIQLTVGYDVMMYFNTVAGKTPIDFDFSALSPKWERGVFRYYHGLSFGIGVTF